MVLTRDGNAWKREKRLMESMTGRRRLMNMIMVQGLKKMIRARGSNKKFRVHCAI